MPGCALTRDRAVLAASAQGLTTLEAPQARRGSYAGQAMSPAHPVRRACGDAHAKALQVVSEDDLAGEPRRPCRMRRKVEQILFLLACRRQLLEIVPIDDHMAGRAGHHALARALQRFARRPGDIEEPLPWFRFHFLVQAPVRPEKTHQCHATRCSCARAAAAILLHASTSCSCVV